MLFSELQKIMVNKVTFLSLRVAIALIAPPPGSAPVIDGVERKNKAEAELLKMLETLENDFISWCDFDASSVPVLHWVDTVEKRPIASQNRHSQDDCFPGTQMSDQWELHCLLLISKASRSSEWLVITHAATQVLLGRSNFMVIKVKPRLQCLSSQCLWWVRRKSDRAETLSSLAILVVRSKKNFITAPRNTWGGEPVTKNWYARYEDFIFFKIS